MYRRGILILCLLWLMPALCPALEPLLLDCAYFEDATGQLGIEAVAQRAFQPSPTLINRGYGASAHWLRLRLRPAESGAAVVLRIRPAQLHDLQLFEAAPEGEGSWKRHRFDKSNPDEQRLGDPAPGFVVHPEPEGSVYYLRMTTQGTSLMQVEALTVAEAHSKSVRTQLTVTLALVVIAAFMAVVVSIWRETNTIFLTIYCLFQVFSACFILHYSGYLSSMLPMPWIGWLSQLHLTILMTALLGGALLIFLSARYLFRIPCSKNLFLLPLLCYPVLLGAVFFLPLPQAFQGTSLFAILLNAMMLALGAVARMDGMRWWPILRFLMVVAGGNGVYFECAHLGWLPAMPFILEVPAMRGMIRAVFWSVGAYEFHRRWQARQEENRLQLMRVTAQWHEQKERSEAQSGLIALLSHELKTPLAVVSMAFDLGQNSARSGDHARRALSDMTAVIERCRQVVVLDSPDFRPQMELCDLDSLMDEAIAGCPAPARVSVQRESLPMLSTDRVMLMSIVRNLLDNAFRYGAPSAGIHLTQHAMEQQGRPGVAISVVNQLGQIGPPDPARLFSKTYRSPAARKHSGSGLGLYLSRGFAEKLSGTLEYVQENTHVRFTLWLPHSALS